MATYKGSSADAQRILALEKKRAAARQSLDDSKSKIQQSIGGKVARITDKFATQHDTVERALIQEATGLQTREQYAQKMEALAVEKAVAQKAKRKARERRKRKQQKLMAQKLSFGMEDDLVALDDTPGEARNDDAPPVAEDDGDDNNGKAEADKGEEDAGASPSPAKQRRVHFSGGGFGKDPSVATHFLPDRDREAQEREEKKLLALKWRQEQEALREQEMDVTYSFYDGLVGQRRTQRIKQGWSIAKLLESARQQFPELRNTTVDNLLFIKEDLIIPQHYTFYDLIVRKARGKSGPLFRFDVHEAVSLANDTRKEKEESHPAKVVERAWYNANKHIFPASRWEIYDPNVKRDGVYTVKGGEVH